MQYSPLVCIKTEITQDAKNALGKVQHSFMIKAPKEKIMNGKNRSQSNKCYINQIHGEKSNCFL